MKWCRKCVLPNTRPNLSFNKDGICSGCLNHNKKNKINWSKRQSKLNTLIKEIKSMSSEYDCLIPVSGGKDSTWQTLKCLELGLKPLAITWKTPSRTTIGYENLKNLIDLGVDHIDFTVNPKIESSFMWETYKRKGSIAIPMHFAIYSIPFRVASNFKIPLIVFGENSAFEYGMNEKEDSFSVTPEWIDLYNATVGTKIEDWFSNDFSENDLTLYRRPTDEDLKKSNIKAIFLGHYFEWDPNNTKILAEKAGFQASKEGPKIGLYDFADIDCNFISLHHWLKWYKFGFTRLFDNLSLEIRNNRITREDAIKTIEKANFNPSENDLDKFCEFTKHTKSEFFEIAEKFRNRSIWKKIKGRDNKWYIPKFIIKKDIWN